MSHVLSVVDTSGIQGYIFGTNRLREHVGASENVLQATTDWVWETLRAAGLRVNYGLPSSPRDDSRKMEDGDLDAEVLYTAGGNAVILFADDASAHTWARRLSEKALRDAPGMALLIAHSDPFTWEPGGTDLPQIVNDLFTRRLDQLKRLRTASVPLLGLGVTATCQSTGLTAIAVDPDDNIRISREIQQKVDRRGPARQRFRDLLADYVRSDRLNLDIPEQLDDLNPNKGERSYIAVVHADGNGMGDRFKRVWDHKTNRSGITALRDLSDKVNRAGQEALQRALSRIIRSDGSLISPYTNKKFPVRPLIYGGDDLTFVCDGRIGLGLAARYLYEFEQVTTTLGIPATAAAGVAIVKTHYPFARAYELSEELCQNGKRQSRTLSTLDWHVALSGLLTDLESLRKREYRDSSGTGDLTMRPVFLRPQPKEWRSWPNVETVLHTLLFDEETPAQPDDATSGWAGKRNKIKQLREMLRAGSAQVEQFRTVYQTGLLPGYTNIDDLRRKGWLNGRCGYFDPIEIIDLFEPPAGDDPAVVTKRARWVPTS